MLERLAENIHPSWKGFFKEEFKRDYMVELDRFLDKSIEYRKTNIYPPEDYIFKAFECPLDNLSACIIGQDPYHGAGQAMGLSFSVPEGVSVPPSLRNIFKELHNDLGCTIPKSGDLTSWSKNVLLLNSVLTVEAGQPGSHQGKGWEIFTDRVIEMISKQKNNMVFILWGKYAQAKEIHIDAEKHKIIRSPHPSPFAAHRGFFGSKPFSQTNEYLISQGQEPIEWQLA